MCDSILKSIFKRIPCIIWIMVGILCFSYPSIAQEQSPLPKSLAELKYRIEQIMDEGNIAAIGIAVVQPNGTVWSEGLGKSDIVNDIDANENTMFRIGSITKMFAALAILKLQEEGLISLKDRIRDIIPEIGFKNSWADEAPILVEHLLEHTTGWNDLHLTEFALNAEGMTLREGLDYHPHSRISRWVPGTRMAYCNSGPAVAAYIVEKITGQEYEAYIKENFFEPLGMNDATFLDSETYQRSGAKNYIEREPQEYYHLIMRPTGAINASPRELAQFTRLFTNRGRIDTLQLISDASLVRMETPSSTIAAEGGLQNGYGLSSRSMEYGSFVYHGLSGSLPSGGLTELSYLPEHGAGYVLMTNSGSDAAFEQIKELIRTYQTRNLVPPTLKLEKRDLNVTDIEGYYVPINPRFDLFYFMERLMGVQWFTVTDKTLEKKDLFGETGTFLAIEKDKFVSPKTGRVNLVVVDDPLVGNVLITGKEVLKPTSAFVVFGLWMLFGLWLLLMLCGLVFGAIGAVQYRRGRITSGANIRIRFWPLIPSLLVVGLVVLIFLGMNDFFQAFGKPGFIAISIFILTIAFALTALWSLFYVIRNIKTKMNRAIYWYSAVLAGLHCAVSCYLLWYGIIGVRTWA